MWDILDRGNIIKEKIKNDLCINKDISIKVNLGRNKFEYFDCIVKEKYNNVFIVETKEKMIKSFTYGDILTKTIIIDYK